jgi:hypothetical protein
VPLCSSGSGTGFSLLLRFNKVTRDTTVLRKSKFRADSTNAKFVG